MWDICVKGDDRRLMDFISAKHGYKGVIARVTKCKCKSCLFPKTGANGVCNNNN